MIRILLSLELSLGPCVHKSSFAPVNVMFTGIELVLAILPMVITAAEHRESLKAGKALCSSKVKEQQLYDFCLELHDELSFLANTLGSVVNGLPSRSDPYSLLPLSPEELQAIDTVLEDRATTFHSLLGRVLEGLDALLSDKSLKLVKSDICVVSPFFLAQCQTC